MYLIIAVAYFVPGKINETSKQIVIGWNKAIVQTANSNIYFRKLLREVRQIITSTRDIRIYFGELNYYENDTCVKVLKFMVDTTVNLVLII